MKKLILFSFIALSIQSCSVLYPLKYKFKKEHCSDDGKEFIEFNQTVPVQFIGIDSSVFKGKNYNYVADSLYFNHINEYGQRVLQDRVTQKIHKIVFEVKDFENTTPYDRTKYECIK